MSLCSSCGPPQSVIMLKNSLNFRLGSNQDSIAARTLNEFNLSGDTPLSLSDILIKLQGDTDNHSEQKIVSRAISRLTKKGHIIKTDDCHVDAKHKITLLGKCRVLCNVLDVKFLELCILSEVYTLYGFQIKNRCQSSYVVCDITDYLDSFYTTKTIRNYAITLCTKKLTYRKADNIIGISEDKASKLSVYDDILKELHGWVQSVPYQLDMLAINHPNLLAQIHSMRPDARYS